MGSVERKKVWPLIAFGAFFVIGAALFAAFLLMPTLYGWWQARGWPSTQGELLHAGLATHHGSDSTTYEATARYCYRVQGRRYCSNRVAVAKGADNVGHFQQRLAARLESAYRLKQPVTVYYDPADPTRALLDRSLRPKLLLFQSLLVIFFGGAGLGLAYLGWRGKPEVTGPVPEDKPWLARPEWHEERIFSSARANLVFPWVFTIGWNLLSIPALVSFPELLQDEGAKAWLLLFMPLVGLGTLAWAVHNTIQWRRFGRTPLVLNPNPGAIGGDVGGEILLAIPCRPDMRPMVTLSLNRRVAVKTKDGKEFHERIVWQQDALAQPVPDGPGRCRLRFRIEVPEGLKPSEPPSDDYHLWRLHLQLPLPGMDLKRDYEIPVYPGERRSTLSVATDHTDDLSPESLLPLYRDGQRIRLYYPMLRHPWASLIQAVFGVFFGGAGLFLWNQAHGWLSLPIYLGAVIFLGVGLLLIGLALYYAFNSLEVIFDGRTVVSIRRWLGLVLRRSRFLPANVRRITAVPGALRKNNRQLTYHVVAEVMGQPKPVILAEGLDSTLARDQVIRFFNELLGHKPRE